MFAGLIERPLIAVDAVGKYPLLLSMFDKELDSCKHLYNKQMKAVKELGEIQSDICNNISSVYEMRLRKRFKALLYASEQFVCFGELVFYV